MANPRNTVDFKGVGYRGFTYYIDDSTITHDRAQIGGSAQAGKLVSFVAGDPSVVKLTGAATDGVLGVLVDVKEDGACTVQVEGGAEITLAAAQSPDVGSFIGGGATAGLGYVIDTVNAATAPPRNLPQVHKVLSNTVVQVYLSR